MLDVRSFISELKSYKAGNDVFNPWKDYDPDLDIGSEVPVIRESQLQAFLESRINRAKHILVGEAVGYQGGRFTGVALTSERLLLGYQKEMKAADILCSRTARRTSNPHYCRFKYKTQGLYGFIEPTATIVWKEIFDCNLNPHDVVTWNIFPFHPFDLGAGMLSNRAPRANEIKAGKYYLEGLIGLYPGAAIVAMGSYSSEALRELGIRNYHVPHPSNGGANDFRKAFRQLFT